MKSICKQCGEEKKSLGRHWVTSRNCSYPDLSEEIKNITEGVLMGDGNISHIKEDKNSYFRVSNSNLEYLYFLLNIYGNLVNRLEVRMRAEELVERNIKNGFIDEEPEEIYGNQYNLVTISHPYFNSLTEWYSSGRKRWPSELCFTPMKLKMLYCCDGGLRWSNRASANIQITLANEIDRKEYLRKIFNDIGISVSFNAKYLYLDNQNTEKFFEYIGGSVRGMEYKWCYRDKEKYKKYKSICKGEPIN